MEVRHYKCSGFCPNSRVAKNTKDLGRGNLPFSSEGGCVGSYLVEPGGRSYSQALCPAE